MSNVTELPTKDVIAGMLGPERSGHSVIVAGRLIRGMVAYDRGAEIEFVLDGRFSYSFPRAIALLAASFAAQAMAIGSGYSHLGAATKDRPFAPEVIAMTELPS